MRHLVAPVAAIIVLLLSPSAHAGPAYYAVTGVAPDDTLNVRMAPNGRAEIIGTLAYNASPIEIIRIENGWGMFPAGEVSGWVSMSFLRPIDQPMIGDTRVPDGVRCIGTEPFWSVTFNADRATASHQNWDGDRSYRLSGAAGSENGSWVSALILDDGVAFITPGQCTDGMSDAEYGWEGFFVLAGPNRPSVLNGCCALQAPIQR